MKRKLKELSNGSPDSRNNCHKKMKWNNIEEKSTLSISSFVQCPLCQLSVYKSVINMHINNGCNNNKKTIKKKLKSVKSLKSNATGLKQTKKKPNHKWIECPLCNKLLLLSQINFHIDMECSKINKTKKKSNRKNKNKNNINNNNSNNWISKITKCPKCGDNVLLTEINMHLDLNCDEQKKKWINIHEKKTNKNKDKIKFDINNYKTNMPGLYLYDNFINEKESKNILTELNGNKWTKNRDTHFRGNRRSQHYGPPMDEMYRVVSNQKYFTPLPELSKQIGKRIGDFWNSCRNIPLKSLHNKLSMNANDFDELLVNEYQTNDQLLFHFDQRGAFEELLCGLSLCNDSVMSFQNKDNKNEIIKVKLPKNSVYFMSGQARYKYKHGFMLNDIYGYRVSLTYRTVKAIFYNCEPPKKKTDDVYTISNTKQTKLDLKLFLKSKP